MIGLRIPEPFSNILQVIPDNFLYCRVTFLYVTRSKQLLDQVVDHTQEQKYMLPNEPLDAWQDEM